MTHNATPSATYCDNPACRAECRQAVVREVAWLAEQGFTILGLAVAVRAIVRQLLR